MRRDKNEPDGINSNNSKCSDTNYTDVYCYEGVRNGDLVQIIIQNSAFSDKCLITLKETGDSDNPYQFCSNCEL